MVIDACLTFVFTCAAEQADSARRESKERRSPEAPLLCQKYKCVFRTTSA